MNKELKIKRLTSTAQLPVRAHATDLGYDLYADETYRLQPGETVVISTGISMRFPDGVGGIIKDRSSMAIRNIHTSGGVIDNGYTGEIRIILTNHSPDRYSPDPSPTAVGNGSYLIVQGAKIAQMILTPIITFPVVEVEDLGETDRGENGFGSSGS